MPDTNPKRLFKRVGLIAKPGDGRVKSILPPLIKLLQTRGVEVVFDDTCSKILGSSACDTVSPGDENDLVIAIGGDGTLLRAAHELSSYEVRLLGVNLGHLGFLTDISPDEIHERLTEILNGEYIEEQRAVLACSVMRDQKPLAHHDALNDVVIHKWNIARVIRFDTYINGKFVHSQRSDGVIVSTPTGSTAYALSGGGPLLDPSLDVILLVPICTHTLSNRPIVVGASSRIEIVVGTRNMHHARLTCDGAVKFELAPGDRVLVEKADRCIHLIHPPQHDHYATLRAKLRWG
jgi:NAD+ kinase